MTQNRRVKFGTPIYSKSALCKTCRNATIMKGQADSQEYTFCSELRIDYPLEIHVTECSKYEDKTQPPLGMMREIAWNLATDKSGKKIGFMSPGKFRRAQDAGELEEDRRAPMYNPVTGAEEW
jgi:hypothetical protein